MKKTEIEVLLCINFYNVVADKLRIGLELMLF